MPPGRKLFQKETRRRKKTASAEVTAVKGADKVTKQKNNPAKTKKQPQPITKRKEPRTAAVTITCLPGKYEETLREARQKIKMEELGIQGAKVRRAITGAYVFEIPGADSYSKANKLAIGMRKALAGKEGVKIQRPTKMTEVRIRGLD